MCIIYVFVNESIDSQPLISSFEPHRTQVMLDGVDVTSLQLHWMRSIIGLVSQEPVMFKASILDNIHQGNPNASMSQVIDAARAANALDFINALPEEFETRVGDGGIQLSGGQKQRVAIARAILRNPKVRRPTVFYLFVFLSFSSFAWHRHTQTL